MWYRGHLGRIAVKRVVSESKRDILPVEEINHVVEPCTNLKIVLCRRTAVSLFNRFLFPCDRNERQANKIFGKVIAIVHFKTAFGDSVRRLVQTICSEKFNLFTV